jgi:hypothetical protein
MNPGSPKTYKEKKCLIPWSFKLFFIKIFVNFTFFHKKEQGADSEPERIQLDLYPISQRITDQG